MNQEVTEIKVDGLTDTVLFRKRMTQYLSQGLVTVIFTKKDGTERTMQCTTSEDLVPQPVHVSNTDNKVDFPETKPARKVNESVMPVYDLEAKTWKSFRWDSIKQVRIEL